MGVLESLTDDGGVVSWVLVGVLALAVLENLVDGDLVWTAFLVATVVVLVLPAAVLRDPHAMLPPTVTALAVLPGVTRAVGPAWATEYATYVGVAAVSLAVVAELTLFTEAELSPRFADAMVVLTTMAAIGAWAVLQFYSDRYLGTEFLGSAEAVMWEFVRATAAGVAAAVVFELYFEYETSSDTTIADLLEGDCG
ncbi:hypothetical protein [Halorussus sp. MSC15.2]|uniref:hypothetical protein n=1 Tax=Halorussus sp. MSC15.2 TaxID=2283638 RepID=UPI0013D7FDED|nr:hypothetical protein [Halorussus sp. MSC15.2]NEU57890.1 hypothetical protein [Halorussus sp. MSC15.2]